MKQLDHYSLPHDHHELIAMIGPRAIVAMGNQDYDSLGDESGWKSINAAKEVWKALGVEDHIGFDFTSHHTHCSAPASQVASAKAFVDKFLKAQAANTAIVIEPQEGSSISTARNPSTGRPPRCSSSGPIQEVLRRRAVFAIAPRGYPT